jgi:hypothetical protein
VVTEVPGFPFPVIATVGAEDVARTIASRTDRALTWMSHILGFEPKVRLEVLGSEDWAKRAEVPIYGMAHYGADGQVWVPATYADLFAGVVSLTLEDAAEADLRRLREVYGDPPILQPFVDLLSVHELAHLYHEQAGFDFGRRWLRELFCNVALEGYVLEREPDARPALETAPLVARQIRPSRFEFSAIDDMDQAEGVNYGWYQAQLHAAAIAIWEAGGRTLLARLYRQGNEAAHSGIAVPMEQLDAVIARVAHDWPG